MTAITWEQAKEMAMPSVKRLARKHIQNCNGYLEYSDLINVGLIGLYDAFTKYEKNSACNFNSYAQFRINGAIIDEIRKNSNLSRKTFEKVKVYEKFLDDFQIQNGHRPTETQINEYLKGKVKNIESAKKGRVYAIHRISECSKVDETCPEYSFIFTELTEKLKVLLPEKNYAILLMKKFEGLTLKEIAARFGISEARVSQLLKESLQSLELHLNVA